MNDQTPPPTPDEEWAKKLKLDFDPEKADQTPPPLPESPDGETDSESDGEEYRETVVVETEPYIVHKQTSRPFTPPPAPTSGQPYNMQNGQPGNPNGEQMPPSYLVWSILALVFCCFPTAIVAIIYSAQVSSKFYAKDYEGAKKCSDRAQIWIIASIVLGIVSAALYVPLSLLSPS